MRYDPEEGSTTATGGSSISIDPATRINGNTFLHTASKAATDSSVDEPRKAEAGGCLNPLGLAVRQVPEKGRGVFAPRNLSRGTLLEESPILVIPAEEYQKYTRHTLFEDYVFTWDRSNGSYALALGLGSLFNHDDSPNVRFELDRKAQTIHYITSRGMPASAKPLSSEKPQFTIFPNLKQMSNQGRSFASTTVLMRTLTKESQRTITHTLMAFEVMKANIGTAS